MKIDKNNMIVLNGQVFTLVTKRDINKDNYFGDICKLCELRNTCDKLDGALCDIHDAHTNQFYIFIDTIEVVSLQLVTEVIDSYEENIKKLQNQSGSI